MRRASAVALVIAAVIGFNTVAIGLSRARLTSPDPTILLRDRHGRFLGETGGTDATGQGYWPIEELPPRVVAATLAAEDRRFWTHGGVDSRAVTRAAWQNLSNAERVSGASTLAMQVARMQRPGSRTYLRKASEAVTALALTRRYGRERVLRHYLRLVPYGNQIHGIGYAARRYLDKPVADLSWAEVAFLAAIPQAPARANPLRPEGRLRASERGRRILDQLLAGGDMSAAEHELAARQIRELRVPARTTRPEDAMHAVLALEETFRRPEHREALGDHPVVTTTLDLDLQKEVAWKVFERLEQWRSRGAGNAAVVVLDRESREVLAWVGSSGYFDDRGAGAIDYARVPRSPGSTLKPFFYALALERGLITPATVLDDLERGAGGIGNADGRFLGPLLPRVALGNSRNVPAANLLATIGLDEGHDFLRRLGLHDGTAGARRYGLGLSLGGMPVTLEQLIGAYTALAGDGRVGELVWYRRQPRTQPRRVLSEDTARQVTLHLSDPMARLPSFPRMGHLEYPFPVAVKTGTSSGYHDAWTVAYSRRYLVGAWVGHPDFRPMAGLSGYRSASRLVRDVLLHLHRDQTDGLEDIGFPAPRGHVAVKLCALTGRRATAATDRVFVEHFRPGQEPTEPSTAWARRAVDARNGLLASGSTPREHVEVRTFIDLPPRYAAWQVRRGLPRPPRGFSDLGAVVLAPAMWAPAAWTPERSHPPRLAMVHDKTERTEPSIYLTSPESGLRVLRDPETPATRASLALRVTVDPPTEQVVWYVDGEPFRVVDYPYSVRWPLAPGEHTFQARLPFRDVVSSTVRVTVY
ncbi:MAG: glycosyl transferase [bacterium]|nr:glycosyl transferase [bacterium]